MYVPYNHPDRDRVFYRSLHYHQNRDRAVRAAAGFFLSNPDNLKDWTADRLFAAILADEDSPDNEREDQDSLVLREPFKDYLADKMYGKEELVEYIEDLATAFINF